MGPVGWSRRRGSRRLKGVGPGVWSLGGGGGGGDSCEAACFRSGRINGCGH